MGRLGLVTAVILLNLQGKFSSFRLAWIHLSPTLEPTWILKSEDREFCDKHDSILLSMTGQILPSPAGTRIVPIGTGTA